MFDKAVTALIENIKNMVSQMLEKADFDRTYTGYVKDFKQVRNGLSIYLYTITINGKDYAVKSKLKYSIGDYALVLVPRNNWGDAKLLSTGAETNTDIEAIKADIAAIKKVVSTL